jgi:uncharacterized membrane protein
MSGKHRKSQAPQQNLGKRPQAEHDEQAARRMVAFEAYEGMLPHPNIVRGWEDIEKGSFARILTMAENDQEIAIERERHSMEMEKLTVQANISYGHRELNLARSGQIYAFGGVVALAGGAVYLLSTGQDIAGYVTLAGALVPTVLALVRQSSARGKANGGKP